MVSRSLRRTALATCLSTALALAAGTSALAASGWQPTGEMSVAHRAHGAALLPDGDVLAISGFGSSGILTAAAERYDAATRTWSLAAPVLVSREYATATTLPGGRILLAGGSGAAATAAAELYDPVDNTWTATGAMGAARSNHSAVLLDDARVLVVGGEDTARVASATGEVYDQATGTWTGTSNPMSESRANLLAALLPNGRVLAAGGFTAAPSLQYRATADLYDPASNSWRPTAPMRTARAQAAVAALNDGRVLVAGGVNRSGFVRGIELYDPAAGTWSDAGELPFDGNLTKAVVLDDGRALLQSDGSRSTVLFNPASGALSATRDAASSTRTLPSLTVLRDGRVLMAGGSGLRSAELFTPPTERSATGAAVGDAHVGTAIERDVTVSNSGGNRLWIDATALTGDPGFAIVADACAGAELAAAGTCVVRVRFTPSAEGARTAQLSFDDNAEASPAVTLTGTGTSAAQPVDPRPPVGPRPPVDPGPGRPVKPSARRAIERFTLARNCVRPTRSGLVRVDLRLRLAQLRPVELRIARALGTKGMKRCPSSTRGFRGKLRGVKTERVRPTAVAATVNGRRVLRARLQPGLYRLTIRLRAPDGRRSAPAHRWLRVLAPR